MQIRFHLELDFELKKIFWIKFGYSEKATKFEKNLPLKFGVAE